MLDNLYNSEILTLASTLRNARLTAPSASARRVSKLCGSALEIDIAMDAGRVTDYALRVQACALGQASAAILGQALIGASLSEIEAAREALLDMLKNNGAPPKGRFEKLALLSGVAAYPARHASTLLAFEAASDAAREAVLACEGPQSD